MITLPSLAQFLRQWPAMGAVPSSVGIKLYVPKLHQCMILNAHPLTPPKLYNNFPTCQKPCYGNVQFLHKNGPAGYSHLDNSMPTNKL